MQYLIKTITHDTGEVFHDVVKARENEVFTLVDAESEEKAREKAKWPKGLLEVIPSSFNNYRSISKPVPNRNEAIPPRKDSE